MAKIRRFSLHFFRLRWCTYSIGEKKFWESTGGRGEKKFFSFFLTQPTKTSRSFFSCHQSSSLSASSSASPKKLRRRNSLIKLIAWRDFPILDEKGSISPFPLSPSRKKLLFSRPRNKEKAFFKMADSSSHSHEKNITIFGSQILWCEEQYVDTFVFGKSKSSGCLLPSSICKKSGERLLCVCVCVGGWGNRWSENLRENVWRSKQHLLSVGLVDGYSCCAISLGKANNVHRPKKTEK